MWLTNHGTTLNYVTNLQLCMDVCLSYIFYLGCFSHGLLFVTRGCSNDRKILRVTVLGRI